MHTRLNQPGRFGGKLRPAAALLCAALSGCAAVTNPVAEGVPVNRLPGDFFPQPREQEREIPLTLLRQKPPDAYRLDSGDVLGVYIEGILGDKTQLPPVHYSEVSNLPPALGFPFPVRDDGAVPLPLVGPVPVRGLTVGEAEKQIVKAYTVDHKFLQPDKAVIVTLVRPREYHVLVVREDSAGATVSPGGILTNTKRGTGAVVNLPAYENDVLNALTRTGGLPGLDAQNEVVIERGAAADRLGVGAAPTPGCPCPDLIPPWLTGGGDEAGQMIHIPLRLPPGETPPIRPEDVVLQNGDIVYIGARDTEVFYTGGLLFARQFILPRDYDLRVTDAIVLAGGPLVNGLQTQNNLSGAIVQSGLGSPSPSLMTVLRKTKCNGLVKIKVDLNKALNDPRENILVQPGDTLILQETPGEAITRYVTTVLRFTYTATFINNTGFTGGSNANLP